MCATMSTFEQPEEPERNIVFAVRNVAEYTLQSLLVKNDNDDDGTDFIEVANYELLGGLAVDVGAIIRVPLAAVTIGVDGIISLTLRAHIKEKERFVTEKREHVVIGEVPQCLEIQLEFAEHDLDQMIQDGASAITRIQDAVNPIVWREFVIGEQK
jgi:hypothetical protein